MALEPLLRRLQVADEALESAWREGGQGASANAKETLLLMERSVAELKAAQATLPADDRARAVARCEAYERKVLAHRSALQASAEEAARGQLLQGSGGSEGGVRRRQQPTSKEEGQRQEMNKLAETRDQLRNQYERMQGIATSLQEDSSKLRKTQDQYNTYESKLQYASQRLGQLKRKMDEDSRYIWWSFIFFLTVSGYICLKRLKVFKMLYLGGSLAVWSGSTVFSVLQGLFLRLTALYEAFCELLGIPSLLDTAQAS
mmetsp:Transcript_47729/g.150073  ORF Transcript_47729/g.150073 Transcript_47729/m.150073 type:complete len:259 (-) Transcript_47729:66-842(-)